MTSIPNTLEKIFRIVDSIKPNKFGCMIYPKAPCSVKWYAGVEIKGIGRRRVHRLVLERKLGRSIGQLLALHTCDNRSCVNPEHLYEGTFKDNMGDRLQRSPNSWKRKSVVGN